MVKQQEDGVRMNDIDIEQVIIGAFLISPEKLIDYSDSLNSNDFTGQTGSLLNSDVIKHMKSNEFDAISVYEFFGANSEILSLANNARVGGYDVLIDRHIEAFLSKRFANDGVKVLHKIAHSGNSHDALEALTGIAKRAEGILVSKPFTDCYQEFDKYIDDLADRSMINGREPIYTPFPMLNKALGGLHRGEVMTIGARPGMGKTSLGLSFGYHAAKSGSNVLFISTEMSTERLLNRVLSSQTGISTKKLRLTPQDLQAEDYESLMEAKDTLKNFYIYYKAPLSISNIRKVVRDMKKRHGVDMVVIDYLQNIKGNGFSTVEKLDDVAKSIHDIAIDCSCHVLALAQSNRESEKSQSLPKQSDLKGSGTIEQASDTIMMLHKNEDESDYCYWMVCVKSRDGEHLNVPIVFNKDIQRITQDDNPYGRKLSSNVQKCTSGAEL